MQKIKDFVMKMVLEKALAKGLKRGVQLIVTKLMALQLEQFGIQLEPGALEVAIFAGLEAVRSKIKAQFGISWL